MRRSQRRAIDKAKIAKRCRGLGPFLSGYKTFCEGDPITDGPHEADIWHKPWVEGWKWGQLKKEQHDAGR